MRVIANKITAEGELLDITGIPRRLLNTIVAFHRFNVRNGGLFFYLITHLAVQKVRRPVSSTGFIYLRVTVQDYNKPELPSGANIMV